MPWIEIITPDDAEGRLKEAYDRQAARLGFPSEFTLLGSLDPELVHIRLELYRVSERIASRLTPRQTNLVAHVVSTINRTAYCASQTRVKLDEIGVSRDELAIVEAGRYDELPAADAALLRYADKLTRDPGAIDADDIGALRDAGFDDLDILHVNNQTAHLNYTNRVARGLGLLHEIDAEVYDPFQAIPT